MNQDKILGCLLGGAVGDAMGAATEVRTREQIKAYFGTYVRDFYTPPGDTFAHGCRRGQITDDFSIAYMNSVEIAEAGGEISEEIAKRALLKWYEVPEFKRFAGPTTKAAILKLKGERFPQKDAFIPAVDNGKGTNGAAMKAAPIALFSGGDEEQAIRHTITMCKVTHNNNVALSGACAVASATAAALRDETSLDAVIEAGIRGAASGDRLGRECSAVLCGPSVEKRIRKAVELGLLAEHMEDAAEAIEKQIGSGLMAAEAVPAAFGLIAAAGGDLLEAIYGGVNIGDDTDTVATMIGGILGAYKGASCFPGEYLKIIRDNNRIDIEGLSVKIGRLMQEKQIPQRQS